MYNLEQLVLLSFAAWRVSSLLVNEEGPFRIFEWFREKTHSLGGLLDCLWCTSVWVAMPVALLTFGNLYWRIVAWLAVATGSIITDSIIGHLEGEIVLEA